MGVLRPSDFTDFTGGAAFSGGITLPAGAISGDSAIAADADITRAKLIQEANASFTIPLTRFKIWDTGLELAVAAGASDDLYLDVGTLGTHGFLLKSDDANGSTDTQYAIVDVVLPECYDDGETVTVRIPAKMGVIADTTNGLDVEAYEDDCNGAAATDICATAVQTMTAAWVNYDFTITPTNLISGDVLLIRIKVDLDDTAAGSGAGVVVNIGHPRLLVDIRG